MRINKITTPKIEFSPQKNNLTIENKEVVTNSKELTAIKFNELGTFTVAFFGKNKKDEKTQKQALYKTLLKNGCKEKEASKILYNDGFYKKYIELKKQNNENIWERKLTDKEIITFIDKDFDEIKIQRYIELDKTRTNEEKTFSREISTKEILLFVENKFENNQIQKYIDIRNEDENGKTLFSRKLEPREAIRVIQKNYTDSQIEVFIRLKDYINQYSIHFNMDSILMHQERCKKLLDLTSKEKTIEMGLSRNLDTHEALVNVLENFDTEKIQKFINLKDEKEKELNDDEVINLIKNNFDEEKTNKFIQLREEIKKTLKFESEFRKREISSQKALDIVKYNVSKRQMPVYLRLSEIEDVFKIMFLLHDERTLIRFEKLMHINQTEKQENEPFSPSEALTIVNKNYDDDEAELYREAKKYLFSDKKTEVILNNKENIKRFKALTQNNTQNSRPLTYKEAAVVICENIEDEKIEEFINLSDKGISTDDKLTLLNFVEFKDKNTIDELSLNEKRVFLKKLIEHSLRMFLPPETYPIMPKTKMECAQTISNLSSEIGISPEKLTPTRKKECIDSLHSLANKIKFVDLNNIKLELNYSKENFITDINKITEKLSDKEKLILTEKFKFSIQDNKLIGYPTILKTTNNKIEEEINEKITEFTQNNKITISNAKELEEDINKIVNLLPELRTMIGKKQHRGHSFTLDIHSLKVLQNLIKNPNFNELEERDKLNLTLVALLHDITKKEGEKDYNHPKESAFEAYYIIQRLDLPEDEQIKIYELINSHNWLAETNNSDNYVKKIQKYAFELRHSNNFELAKLLCEADIKAVRKDYDTFTHFQNAFNRISNEIETNIKKIQRTQIILPQTKIPKASEIKNGTIKTLNGITNTVLYMNDLENDLSKYGFEKGTTKENWRGLVHAFDSEIQLQIASSFSAIDSDALLSCSYIKPHDFRVFRQQGVILDVNFNDIHAGYCSDFGSGFKKTLKTIIEDYLFVNHNPNRIIDRMQFREYIPLKLKEELGIVDSEYIEYVNKIKNCKSYTDIEKIDENLAKGILNALDKMKPRERKGQRRYNEMLVSRPKIQAVFSYDKSFTKIPEYLRKYAQDNDLPIIMLGNSK